MRDWDFKFSRKLRNFREGNIRARARVCIYMWGGKKRTASCNKSRLFLCFFSAETRGVSYRGLCVFPSTYQVRLLLSRQVVIPLAEGHLTLQINGRLKFRDRYEHTTRSLHPRFFSRTFLAAGNRTYVLAEYLVWIHNWKGDRKIARKYRKWSERYFLPIESQYRREILRFN